MPLKAGSKGNLVDSMAKDIENAFRANWSAFMGEDIEIPNTNNPQMQLLIVAIAQGVVKHLQDNAREFTIESGFVRRSIGSGTVRILTDT